MPLKGSDALVHLAGVAWNAGDVTRTARVASRPGDEGGEVVPGDTDIRFSRVCEIPCRRCQCGVGMSDEVAWTL